MKKALEKIFCLPPLATVVIALPSYIFVFSALKNSEKDILAYASYLLSAYALIITVTGLIRAVKALSRKVENSKLVKKIKSTRLGYLILSDDAFRSSIFLHAGLTVNILYIILNFFFGIKYQSFWFAALGFYYIALSAMRAVLVQFIRTKNVREDILAEYGYYRICGIIFLFLNIALCVMAFYRVNDAIATKYEGALIYGVAFYTFYITVSAIVNALKYRKKGSPVLSAVKNISLTSALVSLLSLEAAMMAQFSSESDDLLRKNMTASLGTAICVVVLCMALYMIISSTKKMNFIKQGGNKDEK